MRLLTLEEMIQVSGGHNEPANEYNSGGTTTNEPANEHPTGSSQPSYEYY